MTLTVQHKTNKTVRAKISIRVTGKDKIITRWMEIVYLLEREGTEAHSKT